MLDRIRIYNRALTEQELAAHVRSEAARYGMNVGGSATAPPAESTRFFESHPNAIDSEQRGDSIVVETDVLRLVIDTRGGTVREAELKSYLVAPKSPQRVRLLHDDATGTFVAQSGLVASSGNAPTHHAEFAATATRFASLRASSCLLGGCLKGSSCYSAVVVMSGRLLTKSSSRRPDRAPRRRRRGWEVR